jgi:hypothetical protein
MFESSRARHDFNDVACKRVLSLATAEASRKQSTADIGTGCRTLGGLRKLKNNRGGVLRITSCRAPFGTGGARESCCSTRGLRLKDRSRPGSPLLKHHSGRICWRFRLCRHAHPKRSAFAQVPPRATARSSERQDAWAVFLHRQEQRFPCDLGGAVPTVRGEPVPPRPARRMVLGRQTTPPDRLVTQLAHNASLT